MDEEEHICRGVVALHELRDERDRVYAWRLHELLEAGYPVAFAELLADSEADLHRAVELVEQGCAPETAAAILR